MHADAVPRLGTAAEVETIEDLYIPCCTVEGPEQDFLIISDEVCDDILAAETSESPACFFVPSTLKEMVREQKVDSFFTHILASLNGGF